VTWIPIHNGSGRVCGHLRPELLRTWLCWAFGVLLADLAK